MFYASPCVILILHILLNRLKDFKVNAPVFESVNEKVSSTSSCSTEVRLICFYIVLQQFFFFNLILKIYVYTYSSYMQMGTRQKYITVRLFLLLLGKFFSILFNLSISRLAPLDQWQIKTKININTNQWGLKVRTNKPLEARENANNKVAIVLSFASDWLRGWREFSLPITKRSWGKPRQARITFDTRLKISINYIKKELPSAR